MESRAVELILAHNLSEHLSTPVLLLDGSGALVFFNEPAEEILGLRYEDVGEMPPEVWTAYLQAIDGQGNPMIASDLPVLRAVSDRRPSQHAVRLHLAEGPVRIFEATAVPLTGVEGRHLGSMIIFWSDEHE